MPVERTYKLNVVKPTLKTRGTIHTWWLISFRQFEQQIRWKMSFMTHRFLRVVIDSIISSSIKEEK